jgi:hypothetical protein
MDLGRVFISFVSGDLLDRRKLAADAAKLVGLEPLLTARPLTQAGHRRRLPRLLPQSAPTQDPHHPGPLLPSPPAPLTGRRGRPALGGETDFSRLLNSSNPPLTNPCPAGACKVGRPFYVY